MKRGMASASKFRIRLLAAEYGHRLDVANAANGEIPRAKGDDCEPGTGGYEGHRVSRADCVENAAKEASEAKGCPNSN